MEIKVNGYEFVLDFYMSSGMNGIVLNPDNVTDDCLDDPDYIDAIRYILSIFTVLQKVFYFEVFDRYGLHHYAGDEEGIEKLKNMEQECYDILAMGLEIDLSPVRETLKEIRNILYGKPKQYVQPVPEKPLIGYVYLLSHIGTNEYKIGKTDNPEKRFKSFKTSLPFPTEYVALIRCEWPIRKERKLHQHFADKRKNGEWFELNDDDVEYIKGLSE